MHHLRHHHAGDNQPPTKKNTKKKPEKAIGRTKIVHYFEWYYVAEKVNKYFLIYNIHQLKVYSGITAYLFQLSYLSLAKGLR